MSGSRRASLSRRDLVKRAAGVCVGGLSVGASPAIVVTAQREDAPADLLLFNGKFVDGRGLVGTALTIKNGRIVKIGQRGDLGTAARTIDLDGRSVVPGLF